MGRFGQYLIGEGKLYKAEKLCRQYLKQKPENVEGMRLLADVGIRLKIYDDAEFLLESCIEFEPGNVRARSDYLKILNRKGKFEKALEQARYLSDLEPDNVVYQLALANALGRTLPHMVIFGVQPAEVGWRQELSPAVESMLPALADAVLEELEEIEENAR